VRAISRPLTQINIRCAQTGINCQVSYEATVAATITHPDEPAAGFNAENDSPISLEQSQVFLEYSITALMAGTLLALIVLQLIAPDQVARTFAPLLVSLIALTGWYFLRRGKIRASKIVLALGAWTALTGTALFTEGVRSPAIIGYPMIILVGAWLINLRAGLTLTCMTIVSTFVLMWAESSNFLPLPLPSSLLIYAIDQSVIYILSVMTAVFLVRAYKGRLAELRRVGDALSQRTRDLQVSKSQLDQAQAIASVGSWVYDLGTDTMTLSDETCRIFGLPPGALGNRELYLKQTYCDDRVSVDKAWKAALRGDGFDHEHRIRVGDTLRWVRQKAQFTLTADGTSLSAVGIAQDITARMQAESELRIRDERFQLLFSRASDGILILRSDGTIVAANESFARMHGYQPENLESLNLRDLDTPETVLGLPGRLKRILAGETLTFEVEHYHKDGHVVPLEVTASLIVSNGESLIQAFHRDITERRQAQARINNLAYYDSLTNLPNRRLLMDRLAQACTAGARHQQMSALLFIDLDNFKGLNDTLGHLQGDILLAQVAQRLGTCVREGDTVARLGSDEFVVILEDLSRNEIEAATQTRAIGEKVLATLGQEHQLGHGAYRGSCSIGIALFGGHRLDDNEEPLKRAELAMYQAKAAGRNAMRFFDPQMQIEVTHRLALEADLREAVLHQQFALYYQMQVVDSGRLTGVEALIRWQHPLRGLVSPAEFIPLAEETGLILPIGQWVMEVACRQLALWANRPEMEHLTIAVNVSARQFHQKEFVDQVLAVLEKTGANPKRLKLELTESMLVKDVEDMITKMGTLKLKGVSFSLDDFGTGYSSLSYLKRLPLDQLKIDQGFVKNILTDPNDSAIARTIVALGNSLGLSVIAEGVEIEAQRDFLAGLGCHAYQGYQFSRPMPMAALENHIRQFGRTAEEVRAS